MDLNVAIKSSFGKKFELARKNAGYSRSKLGIEIGVSGKTIQSWEIGRSFPENMSLIPIVEQRLGIFIPKILGDTVREEMKKIEESKEEKKIIRKAVTKEEPQKEKEEESS